MNVDILITWGGNILACLDQRVQEEGLQALELTADYLLNEEEGDFLTPVELEDKSLVERVKLIDSLDSEERSALMKIIDAPLTKNKMVDLALQERGACMS
jgi:hypothetical protein